MDSQVRSGFLSYPLRLASFDLYVSCDRSKAHGRLECFMCERCRRFRRSTSCLYADYDLLISSLPRLES